MPQWRWKIPVPQLRPSAATVLGPTPKPPLLTSSQKMKVQLVWKPRGEDHCFWSLWPDSTIPALIWTEMCILTPSLIPASPSAHTGKRSGQGPQIRGFMSPFEQCLLETFLNWSRATTWRTSQLSAPRSWGTDSPATGWPWRRESACKTLGGRESSPDTVVSLHQ